jgi:hypothetical protein
LASFQQQSPSHHDAENAKIALLQIIPSLAFPRLAQFHPTGGNIPISF